VIVGYEHKLGFLRPFSKTTIDLIFHGPTTLANNSIYFKFDKMQIDDQKKQLKQIMG